jgi:general secretion pathway protein M
MSFLAPDPRRGRLLAVLLLAIALLAGYLLFVHWWFTAPLLESRSELIELRDQEQRLRTTAQQRPLIEQRLAEVRAFEAENPGFLPEANFDLAASALIQRLQSLVDGQNAGADCTVVSRSPMPRQREAEPFLRVAVQVQLRCEVEYFAAVLHGLESGSPQLFVSDLSVTGSRNLMARRQTAAQRVQAAQGAGTGAGHLDFRFSLYGYMQQSGATP